LPAEKLRRDKHHLEPLQVEAQRCLVDGSPIALELEGDI
jgi:hypothetical protein